MKISIPTNRDYLSTEASDAPRSDAGTPRNRPPSLDFSDDVFAIKSPESPRSDAATPRNSLMSRLCFHRWSSVVAYRKLMSSSIWEDSVRPTLGASGKIRKGRSDMIFLSGANLSRLRKTLGTLDKKERDFLKAVLETPLYAVHFTHTNLTPSPEQYEHSKHQNTLDTQPCMRIDSLDNLARRGIKPAQTASGNSELRELCHGDFVFFSIEAGAVPKKSLSNLGKSRKQASTIRYRFPITKHRWLIENSWVSLDEMYADADDKPPRKGVWSTLMKSLAPDDHNQPSHKELIKYSDPSYVFFGRDIAPGIGLSLIERIRSLKSEQSRTNLLAARDEATIDLMINGFFRPELKCPQVFMTWDSESAQPAQLGPR